MAARVLIVEDDPAQRRILEEMVKRFGFEPVSVEGGQRRIHDHAHPDHDHHDHDHDRAESAPRPE